MEDLIRELSFMEQELQKARKQGLEAVALSIERQIQDLKARLEPEPSLSY